MLKAFEDNNICYCLWKSNEHLEEALEGDTDLDILFDASQHMEMESTLSLNGLKRFRAMPLMQYNAIEDFIGFDKETAKIWHLHVHYQMTLGEKHLKGYTITPWANIILKGRIRSEMGVYIIAPEYELVLLFCRIALKLRLRDIGRSLSDDDRNEITYLLNKVSVQGIRNAAMELLGNKATAIILDLLKTPLEKKNQFSVLQKALIKDLKMFTGYTSSSSWLTRTRRELFWLCGGIKRRMGINNYEGSRRVSPYGGKVAVVLGCDGAGKSTTLSALHKEFSKKLDVVSLYFGSGDGDSAWFRYPFRIIARRVGGKGLGRRVEKERKAGKVSFKSVFYTFAKIMWAVVLAKEKEQKLRRMTAARNHGLLVLADRYPQSVMPEYNDGPLLARYRKGNGLLKRLADWEYGIYKSASVNPPDIAIKLTVPTTIAIQRKPEMTLEEIEKKKEAIELMEGFGRMVTIDTSVSLIITKKEAMQAIWDVI